MWTTVDCVDHCGLCVSLWTVWLQNWTTWLLADPLVRTHCGHISELYPAPVVFPATREVMEGYKVVSRNQLTESYSATQSETFCIDLVTESYSATQSEQFTDRELQYSAAQPEKFSIDLLTENYSATSLRNLA